MSLDQHLAHWIDPSSDPAVTLTMEQKGSLAILSHSRLLPECLPVAAPADGGNVQLDYTWYPGDRDTIRVTMAPNGDLLAVYYRHEPCDGDGGSSSGEWKLDTGPLWESLKGAILQD